jgi:hypothetical protein
VLGPSAMMRTEWYEQGEGEEPALLMHPSRTAAAEPYPLPMERTALTVSVVICASTEPG